MTFNAIGYFIYLPITGFITIVVGKSFHENGIYYIKSIVPEKKIATSLNNLLLIGYYLVNIGYAFISIIKWEHISSSHQLIEEVSGHKLDWSDKEQVVHDNFVTSTSLTSRLD